jgi:hypothetical protein
MSDDDSRPVGASVGASVADEVLGVALRLAKQAPDDATQRAARAIVDRLQGPLRVAIAGRVKAGKSTLLNALVGERLAPTDAGECTKLITVYQRGAGYDVTAHLRDDSTRSLTFQRSNGALTIELGSLREADVARLDVSWPTSSLQSITLIDTPGLASVNDENSRRTREFLEADGDGPGEADAVIYLMRHAHRTDVAFLDAFMDRSVSAASPVNAVAVLSRADEIGAGRLDAMESAARIAQRYAADGQLRTLCAAIVPLSGLVAETGLTLREDETAALRTLAATDPAVLEQMLMSADQFCEVSASELTVEWRRDLLDRLGVFGLRVAVDEIRSGRSTTAAQLGAALVRTSGLPSLRELIGSHFGPRARVLQARSGLLALRAVVRRMAATDATVAADLDRELERIEASTLEFAQMRSLHLIASGVAAFDAPTASELRSLLSAHGAAAALGLAPDASRDDVQRAALQMISRWRTRAADPLADPTRVEVCETAVRCAEALYAATLEP